MKHIRLALVGVGTVARGMCHAIHQSRTSISPTKKVRIIAISTRRLGFAYREQGFDLAQLTRPEALGGLFDLPDVDKWKTAEEGLRALNFDIVADTTGPTIDEAASCASRLELSMQRGASVITSSKWAVATALHELLHCAQKHGVEFRFESTVMSGTPVLSTIRDGMPGARITQIRAILNAVANFILTAMEGGSSYEDAVAETQRLGYTEPDPSADTDGYDALAKILILAQLVTGRNVDVGDVPRQGVSSISLEQVQAANRGGRTIRELASMSLTEDGSLNLQVKPVEIRRTDILAQTSGVQCGLEMFSQPLGRTAIIGPGAGPEIAGVGIFADLNNVLRLLHNA